MNQMTEKTGRQEYKDAGQFTFIHFHGHAPARLQKTYYSCRDLPVKQTHILYDEHLYNLELHLNTATNILLLYRKFNRKCACQYVCSDAQPWNCCFEASKWLQGDL